MARQSSDYDSVFKTLKKRHQRLFIAVIKMAFDKHYPMNVHVELLPTDGQFVIPDDEGVDIEERDSDMLLVIQGDKYLVECQSYDDETMAIRIAEYSFIAARNTVDDRNGRMVFTMPNYVVLYVKSGSSTPEYTKISFRFPDGETVDYDSKNLFISDFSRERIIEEGLYVFIPFYVIRYYTALSKGEDTALAEEDLEYFVREMDRLTQEGLMLGEENVNIKGLTQTVIRHITDGNENEERLVNIMGGHVLETLTEKCLREGREQGREQGLEQGLERVNSLNNRLIEAGRFDDVVKASKDREYQEKLMAELIFNG